MKKNKFGFLALAITCFIGISAYTQVNQAGASKDIDLAMYQLKNREGEILMAKKALYVAEKSYGIDHPKVATCLHRLAELYRNEGNFAEADALDKRAQLIDKKAEGTKHKNAINYPNNLAGLF